MDYDHENCREIDNAQVEECLHFKEEPTVTWINVDGIHQVKIMEQLGESFGLHPLTVEDILNTHQRPKWEDFGQIHLCRNGASLQQMKAKRGCLKRWPLSFDGCSKFDYD